MKAKFFTVLVFFLFSTMAPGQIPTATVRGRLLRGMYPAVYVQVTVYNQVMSRSSPVITGQDGMYYIRGVPYGVYYLEVWAYRGSQPLVYQIQVNYPVTDIPAITIP